jgi:hypothetical protein
LDNWRERGSAHFFKATSKPFMGGNPMFRCLESTGGDSHGVSEANRETWGCNRLGVTWGLEMRPFKNGHTHALPAGVSRS